MDIFSKKDGPRLEDVKAKKLLSDNAGTIRRLADQISNGGYSQMQADKARRQQTPKAKGLIIHDLKQRTTDHTPDPYVKVQFEQSRCSGGPGFGAPNADVGRDPG